MAKKGAKESLFAKFCHELKEIAPVQARQIDYLEERRYFLIVCEGQKTEPNYFEYFRRKLPNRLLETIHVSGIGANTLDVVNEAIQRRNERINKKGLPPFDEVWAVFDRDSFPAQRFNEAVELCQKESIESGHSNESFELWYLLHFMYLDTCIHRASYIDKLEKYLGYKYKKNAIKTAATLFEKGNVRQAIEWARQLEQKHSSETSADSCPMTRVYLLVERLLEYVQD